ncbi:MAG: serine protease [Solirubrobacteraceae bacterium]|nr:serine protease [Solirubrobacteraceae bacterium]
MVASPRLRRTLALALTLLAGPTLALLGGATARADDGVGIGRSAVAPPAGQTLGGAPAEATAGHRIIGGSASSTTADSPYSVALQVEFGADEYASCSGTILDPTHVLTAAHCVREGGVVAAPGNVLVAAGIPNINDRASHAAGQIIPASVVRVHPNYSDDSFDADAAMLTLSRPLAFSANVQALPLAAPNRVLAGGHKVRATGFGITATNADDFGQLRSVTTYTVPSGLCGVDAPAVLLCTYRSRHGACQGDSGGTGSLDGSIVGITNVSAGRCEVGYNLFANVSAPEIRTFIDAALVEQDVTSAQIPLSPRGGQKIKLKGTKRVGRRVTCRRGAWKGKPKFRYMFFRLKGKRERDTKWQRSKLYRITSADRGWKIGCAVKATNAGGTGISATQTADTVRSRR